VSKVIKYGKLLIIYRLSVHISSSIAFYHKEYLPLNLNEEIESQRQYFYGVLWGDICTWIELGWNIRYTSV